MRLLALIVTAALVSSLSFAVSSAAATADASGVAEVPSVTGSLNGFEIDPKTDTAPHIRGGGPKRDDIHSVDTPLFVAPADATWAPPPVATIGVEIGGEARAYPIHLMEYHQIVNDTVGGVPVAVTFDPLTAIPIVWQRNVKGQVLEFGVSGLLYREQFLLYDRQTESLWAQYDGVAVAGPLVGVKLVRVPSRQEPVGAWLGRYPQAQIMARPEARKIDYRYSPFESYWVSNRVPVPVRASDERYHPKEVVLGVEVAGKYRAYLGSILTAEGGRIVDTLGGEKIRIVYDSNLGLFLHEASEKLRVTDAYWFAWKSLHPDTEIWHGDGSGDTD